MNVDGAGTSSAMRRRQRRLRAMLRHELQTVAMELAAALHHSRDVGPGKNDGLRAQKTASSGKRPGVAVTVGYVAVPGPLLSAPMLADTAADTVDARTVQFLLHATLLQKKEEAQERRRKWEEEAREREFREVNSRVMRGEPLSDAEDASWRQSHGLPPLWRSFLALVLVVFNGSGIALLVFLVVIPLLVLCSPRSTIGTWCSASPPVWT